MFENVEKKTKREFFFLLFNRRLQSSLCVPLLLVALDHEEIRVSMACNVIGGRQKQNRSPVDATSGAAIFLKKCKSKSFNLTCFILFNLLHVILFYSIFKYVVTNESKNLVVERTSERGSHSVFDSLENLLGTKEKFRFHVLVHYDFSYFDN